MKKRILSTLLAALMLIGLAPALPAASAEEIPDVTQYSYEVIPLLENFCYYLYVKTDNPDPTSFRLVDRDSAFYDEDSYSVITIPFFTNGLDEYNFKNLEPGTYYAVRGTYPDVIYEDEETWRVRGGYLFTTRYAYSDGGTLVLQQKADYGSDYFDDIFKDTAVTIPCPVLHTESSYLVDRFGTEGKAFFDVLDEVQTYLDQVAIYPRSVRDIERPNTDRPYPFLAASPYYELTYNEHYEMYMASPSGILLSKAYPFVLDSLGFPGTVVEVAKALDPECTIENDSVHYLYKITHNGESHSYGGAGKGGRAPLYSNHIEQVFRFDGSESDYATDATVERFCDRLYAYRTPAEEDAAAYRDLINGDTFRRTIAEIGGTWVRVAVEGWFGYGTTFGYIVPLGSSYRIASDAWVDGRYVGQYEEIELGTTFADHPNADIVVQDMTYTDRYGIEHTQDVLYSYEPDTDTWSAKFFYANADWYSSGWVFPDEFTLTREQVEAMEPDRNSAHLPASGLIYDGKEAPGTPFTLRQVTGVSLTDAITIYVEAETVLRADVQPEEPFDGRVTWSVDDEAQTLSVNDNYDDTCMIRIIGLAPGTATLTVKTVDGAFTASCVVTVLENPCGGEHNWDEGVVTVEPTCGRDGTLTKTCIVCGKTMNEDIPATGEHIWGEWQHGRTATCTDYGYDYRRCTVCDARSYEWYDMLPHTWDKGKITKPATVTEPGEILYTCTVCGTTMTDVIPALVCNHEHITNEHKDATCAESGYDRMICSDCGKTIADESIPALGHVWDDGKVTTPATATTYGVKTFTCTRCGETKTEIIPATGGGKPCDGGPACPSYRFTDVKTGDWYHEAVDFAVKNGLFNGMSETTFEPNTPMTRGMLVTVLWRFEGCPQGGVSGFADVKASDWFSPAVAWAARNKIVTGVGDNKFDPNGKITREQLAAILFRYSNNKGYDTSKTDNLSVFPDAGNVSDWAKDACCWAVGVGLISGNNIGGKILLDPQGNATRAQVATILMRFICNLAS